MKTRLERRLLKLLRTQVTPYFGDFEFQQQGLAYCRSLRDLSWIIKVANSRFDTPVKYEFTFDVGIHVPGIMSTYLNREEPDKIDIAYCCCSARLGLLHEDHLDVWWTLREDDDELMVDEQVSLEIQNRFQQDGLPFLEQFQSHKDVIAYLEQKAAKDKYVFPRDEVQRLSYLGILHLIQGADSEARECIHRAREVASRGPLADHINNLFRRLVPRASAD